MKDSRSGVKLICRYAFTYRPNTEAYYCDLNAALPH
ncbi:hypothetical protein K875_02218 [Mycobacterium [tuberculosis] TKK-01-0051]|uniref:Uncharacterized protein n=1 Tax=Mycobacterium [tuberculosis] TKK-01-0051 TaxID=1324261 RepID=A0A051U2T1_9MYCO|nr:hypothetical protein K875_02218 [Mycobacterium [tuberculosis] TKK-01-0051]